MVPVNIYIELDAFDYQTATQPVNVTQIGGVAQSATDLKDFADTGYDPATHKVAGVVLTDTTTTLTNLPSIPNNWITTAGITDGAFTAAKFASGAFDAVWTVATRTITSLPAITAGWLTSTGIADGAFTAAKFGAGALDAVWSTGTRTLTGFGSLAADTATAVWGAGSGYSRSSGLCKDHCSYGKTS